VIDTTAEAKITINRMDNPISIYGFMGVKISTKSALSAVYKAFTLVLQAFYGKNAAPHPMSYRFTFYFHQIKDNHEIPHTCDVALLRIGIRLSATGRIAPIGAEPAED
jgi:hypothetical protein